MFRALALESRISLSAARFSAPERLSRSCFISTSRSHSSIHSEGSAGK